MFWRWALVLLMLSGGAIAHGATAPMRDEEP
jgi:hypothetical protein